MKNAPLDNPATPAHGTTLCKVSDISEPGAKAFEFRAGSQIFELFVVRSGGLTRAYVNACPHRGTPLDWVPGRFLTEDGSQLLCATHGARFRIEDGLCTLGPCPGKKLNPVPIHIVNGEIRAGESEPKSPP